MTNPAKIALDMFMASARLHNICCVDEDDARFTIYSVRVPSPRLDGADLNALECDDAFGLELAAWLRVRAAAVRDLTE